MKYFFSNGYFTSIAKAQQWYPDVANILPRFLNDTGFSEQKTKKIISAICNALGIENSPQTELSSEDTTKDFSSLDQQDNQQFTHIHEKTKQTSSTGFSWFAWNDFINKTPKSNLKKEPEIKEYLVYDVDNTKTFTIRLSNEKLKAGKSLPNGIFLSSPGYIVTIHYPGGQIYKGRILDGKRDGNGWFQNEHGDIYDGEWKAGIKHGKGELTYADGNYEKGTWHNGIFKKGEVKYNNQYLRLFTAIGYTIEEAEVSYDGDWKEGLKHGKGKIVYADGSCYNGDWIDNKRTGKGKYVYADSSYYDGEWVNGEKYGYGIFVSVDGKREEWKDGKKLNWFEKLINNNTTYGTTKRGKS